MSELSEQLFKDMFFFCDQYVEQNTGNFKQKRSELIFKKLKEELKGNNVATLPVDYAPTSFQTIVNRTLTHGVLVSIERLTNFTEFPYDNSETVIVDVYNSGQLDEQGYLANLNKESKGFITKSNLYIINHLDNNQEILKHLGSVKNKHPNLEVMVYFIGENILSDLDKTFLSAFLDMFPEKSFVVATNSGESETTLEEGINDINERKTPSNLNGKLLDSLTEESAKNNAVYNVPSKTNRSEIVIKKKMITKLDSLALIQLELLNIYIQGQENKIRLKSASDEVPVVEFDVTNENKDKLINIISEDLFGDNGRGPLYFVDERGQKYDEGVCESDEQGGVKQFICSCATINQEIDGYLQKIKYLENGIKEKDKTFKEQVRREADLLAAELAADRPAADRHERRPAVVRAEGKPKGGPAADRPERRPAVVRRERRPKGGPAADRPEGKPKGGPAADRPEGGPAAVRPERRPAEGVEQKLTFVKVDPDDDDDLKDKAPEITYKKKANGRSKIKINFNFTEADKIAASGYLLYKNDDTKNTLDELVGMPNKKFYTNETLPIELTVDIKTTDSIHLQLNSAKYKQTRTRFEPLKEYIFTYSL